MRILLALLALAVTPAAVSAQYTPASRLLLEDAPALGRMDAAPPSRQLGVALISQDNAGESEMANKLLAAAYLGGTTLLVAGGASLLTHRKKAAFVGGVIGGTVTVAGLSLAIYLSPSPGSTTAVGFLLWPPVGAAAGSLLAVQLAR